MDKRVAIKLLYCRAAAVLKDWQGETERGGFRLKSVIFKDELAQCSHGQHGNANFADGLHGRRKLEKCERHQSDPKCTRLWARFTFKPGFSGQRLSSASLKVSIHGWKVELRCPEVWLRGRRSRKCST